mmetsp:Transcript_32105/g.70264  ORF Transcript_32105/g.70264 Transcript_32105/m.70264 type:complete len:186 (-) Transcript_32105:118-675(-)
MYALGAPPETVATAGAQFNTRMGLYGRRTNPKLSSNEVEIIDVAWKSFSEDNFITSATLLEAFRSIDAEGDIHDIQLLIDDIDVDGNGKVDQYEFEQVMTRKFLGEDDDSSFVHAFRMLDEDKDGYIPLVEFRHLLMKEGNAPLSELEVDELMMFADVSGDGLINYEEFLRWLSDPDGWQSHRKA